MHSQFADYQVCSHLGSMRPKSLFVRVHARMLTGKLGKVASLAALGALTLPHIERNSAEALASSSVHESRHPQKADEQDPRRGQNPQQNIEELRKRLAVLQSNLQSERESVKELRSTQEAFNRYRKLGTPMERESSLRRTVEEQLSILEERLERPVQENIRKIYSASIDAVFSETNIQRDKNQLDHYLKANIEGLLQKDRADIGEAFTQEMQGWALQLKTNEAIQRLEGATTGRSLVIDSELRNTADAFLTNPLPENVRILANVSAEYVSAKGLFLERALKERGLLHDSKIR